MRTRIVRRAQQVVAEGSQPMEPCARLREQHRLDRARRQP